MQAQPNLAWGNMPVVDGWIYDGQNNITFFDHPLSENELWCASATKAIQLLRYSSFILFSIVPEPTSPFHYLGASIGSVVEVIRHENGTLGGNMLQAPMNQFHLDIFNDAKNRFRHLLENRYGPRARKFNTHRQG